MDDKPETPDMESVIAEALAVHWNFSTSTDDYPRFVDRCDGCHAIVHYHGRDENQDRSYAAHQARAVLAAISEAGTVEWGVLLDDLGSADLYESEEDARIAAKAWGGTVVSRITFPWQRAE